MTTCVNITVIITITRKKCKVCCGSDLIMLTYHTVCEFSIKLESKLSNNNIMCNDHSNTNYNKEKLLGMLCF